MFKKKSKPSVDSKRGDIAIRPYRKVTKDARQKKERAAFDEKLKVLAGDIKHTKVGSKFCE